MVTSILENEHRNILDTPQSLGLLSSRETEVLKFLAEGKSHKEAGLH